jgi:predicted Zn finger-like uncharacterized protein
MIIQCQSCKRKFIVKDSDIPSVGRNVQCGYCSVIWHQIPVAKKTKTITKVKKNDNVVKSDESPSIDAMKASDGKTYKFLGSQWAQLLPSGKTGLFAKKKIGQELDEITGRKVRKVNAKRQKKFEDVDPSSESLNNENNLSDVYKPRKVLGLFSYFFLIIIIAASGIGVLKIFEINILNYYPEMEFVFLKIDEQLIFLQESIRNITIIIVDLINSY